MIKTEVVIIGAGAAGLMAANLLEKDFIILEKNKKAGIKVLISGLGQCNYTNNCDLKDFFDKYGESKRFVQFGISKFTNKDTMEFFKKRNLESFIREDSKVFPKTLKASDLVETLLEKIYKKIRYNSEVLHIEKKEEDYIVTTINKVYKAKSVIVATGGRTYPKTGTTGDGYKFAKELDIDIVKLKNGLCGINTYENYSDLAGNSFKNINIDLYRDNKKLKNLVGDLLFTHKGLTGPVIINNARELQEDDILEVNLVGVKYNEFEEYINGEISKNPKKNILSILKELNIPRRVLEILFKDNDLSIKASDLKKNVKKQIITTLAKKEFKIKKVGNLEDSMVTVGGVSKKEINKKTMESKIYSNLFFIGEVLDVDGDTGGFNIQWAFSSAYLASNKLNEN